MEELNLPLFVKIDNEAPSFDLPYYDPKSDSDGSITLADLQ
jgi:hypothetical protein